eukprot:Gb_23950 [translate_table: standard]
MQPCMNDFYTSLHVGLRPIVSKGTCQPS